MTIISVGKMWSRDTSTATSDGKKRTRVFREGWQVVTTADTRSEEVEAAIGLPQVDDLYPGTDFIFCRSVSPKRVGPIYWFVDVEYSGETGPGGPGDSPLNNLPVIRWGVSVAEEAEDLDDWNLPITNTNGEMVEGITRKVVDSTLFVQRNYATFSQYLTRLYLTSVNSDWFADWPPGTGKLMDFSADFVHATGGGYWSISAAVHFREPRNTIPARAWWKRYLNRGLKIRSKANVAFGVSPAGDRYRAMGYPVVDTAGAISSIAITSRGSGYVAAPAVTITGTDGSGATAAAIINADGEVVTATVTSGGSGYKPGLWRATDDRKEPITEPVNLNYDGSELNDSSLGVWLERPVGVTPLPYNALGLL